MHNASLGSHPIPYIVRGSFALAALLLGLLVAHRSRRLHLNSLVPDHEGVRLAILNSAGLGPAPLLIMGGKVHKFHTAARLVMSESME
jgi:hypothetical protein